MAVKDKPFGRPQQSGRPLTATVRGGRVSARVGTEEWPAGAKPRMFNSGCALDHAQSMAAPRTTKLYDRTRERLTQDKVERIRL